MGKLKSKLRRIVGLFGLYRRSRILTFFVDHTREAHRLRTKPQEAADEAHLSRAWNFDNPIERKWQSHVLSTLQSLEGETPWGDALEIGCSEGVFTLELAQRCRSVTAFDISPVAAERAAERCGAYSNVRIEQLDAATEEIQGQYDLVFVMDILWLVVGRARKASIISKLAHALRDGGLLVFSDSRMPKGIRHRFWNLFFPSGADEWAKLLEDVPSLSAIHKEIYPPAGQSIPGWWDKLFVLYRKVPATEK